MQLLCLNIVVMTLGVLSVDVAVAIFFVTVAFEAFTLLVLNNRGSFLRANRIAVKLVKLLF